MKLEVIAVSNKLSNWENEGLNYYLKQFPKYVKFFSHEIQQYNSVGSIETIKNTEYASIANQLSKESSYVIAFDRHGKTISSKEFASFLSKVFSEHKKVSLVIGGSHGLNQKTLESADTVISFSKLTLPHKLFRVVLIEQIYRAFAIIQNKPYHK